MAVPGARLGRQGETGFWNPDDTEDIVLRTQSALRPVADRLTRTLLFGLDYDL
jgi:hypothetical protein